MQPKRIRRTYDLTGIVQGVGFRPATLRLAATANLSGWIQNRSDSVRLALEGPERDIDAFMEQLHAHLPPNAAISTVTLIESLPVDAGAPLTRFSILPSFQTGTQSLLIPADLGLCPDCASEICDPTDRRYGYPFATCVNCGPRYTIINTTPYDRIRTTMSVFPMCKTCRREYENPANRRFHAETIACPNCGPRLHLEDASGQRIDGNPLVRARRELAAGHIIAMRGIGGFLLTACAFDRDALETLRRRKRRPHKPFAVMAASIQVLKRYCIVPPEAERLLASPEAPIVILDMQPDAVRAGILPIDLITPDALTVGAMLPSSPLHKILFSSLGDDEVPAFDLLIMTSGNRGGEPICISNSEARERLHDIADFFLEHNREINLRSDDSLCVLRRNRPQLWRRARGYAPKPIRLLHGKAHTILAMGADMKNTITLAYDNTAVMSPHIGDLETPEAMDSLEKIARSLPEFLMKSPDAIAVDLHPDMASTRLGWRLAAEANIHVSQIQHHYAHAAACLEENWKDKGLALVFDGTGLGTDGSIWGAELLEIDLIGFKRLATFAGVPLPGGDAAIRNPARQLVARLLTCGADLSDEWRRRLNISETECSLWSKQCIEHINSPVTHAAGRLFDSFSTLLGFAHSTITYEGQPAIRLEAAARRCTATDLPNLPFSTIEHDDMLVVDWHESFAMLSDPRFFTGREDTFALAVHHAVASAAVKMVEYGLGRSSMRTIALSGGVFMNEILDALLVPRLEKMGLTVVTHHATPPNDGCISFGQAVITGGR